MRQLVNAEVFFLDSNNHIYLIHPEVGSCHDSSKALSSKKTRQIWQKCFTEQSIWIPTWIKKVTQAKVKHENCESKNIPLIILEETLFLLSLGKN